LSSSLQPLLRDLKALITHTRREFVNRTMLKRHSRHIFYHTDKVKLIARIIRSTLDRICNDGTRSTPYECRRANDEGAINIKDKIASTSIWENAKKKQHHVCEEDVVISSVHLSPHRNRRDFALEQL